MEEWYCSKSKMVISSRKLKAALKALKEDFIECEEAESLYEALTELGWSCSYGGSVSDIECLENAGLLEEDSAVDPEVLFTALMPFIPNGSWMEIVDQSGYDDITFRLNKKKDQMVTTYAHTTTTFREID